MRRVPLAARRGLPVAGACALAATLAIGVTSALASTGLAPSAQPNTGGVNASLAFPAFSPSQFQTPNAALRPKYRWWQPVAYTNDAEIQRELGNVAADFGGGLEQNGFPVSMNDGGASTQFSTFANSQQFGQMYGWGSPLWSHRTEVYEVAAEMDGVIGDMNEGSRWNNTAPDVWSPNQAGDAQDLDGNFRQYQPGQSPNGELPQFANPSQTGESTRLTVDAPAGSATLYLQSIAGLLTGDQVTVGVGSQTDFETITSVGTPSDETGLTEAASAGSSVVHVAEPPTSSGLTAGAQASAQFVAGESVTIGQGPTAESDVISNVGTFDIATAPTAIDGPPGNTSATSIPAGTNNVEVASATNFLTGDTISFSNGESGTITSVGGSGSGTTLATSVGPGLLQITVASASGLSAGEWIEIGANGDPLRELERISSISGTTISLYTPLANGHASGVAVYVQSLGVTFTPALSSAVSLPATVIDRGTGITLQTPLQFNHPIGDQLLAAGTGVQVSPALTHNHYAGSNTRVATTLSANTAVGATNIKVASINNVVVGDTLTVGQAGYYENVTVTAVGSSGATGTGISVAPSLSLVHYSGDTVVDVSLRGPSTTLAAGATQGSSTIDVTSAAAFSAGSSITIDQGTASYGETQTIVSIGAAGAGPGESTVITLGGPLGFSHAGGAPVDQLVSTTLSAPASSGATNITVTSAAGIGVNDSITIDSGATNAETKTVTAISANTLTVSALAHSHSSGAAVVDTTDPGSVGSGGINDEEIETPVAVELEQCLAPSIADQDVAANTSLSAAVTAPTNTIHVGSASGMSVGDVLTVDTGSAAETSQITAISGTTITLANSLQRNHASGAGVWDTCPSAASGGTRELDPSSYQNVTSQSSSNPATSGNPANLNWAAQTLTYADNGGTLPTGGNTYTPPGGAATGMPWELISFNDQGDSQTNAGGTATTPNQWLGHLSAAAADAMTSWFDNDILNDPATQAAIDYQDQHNGTPAAFEDSIENNSNINWLPNMISQWQSDLGYDVTPLLPVLLGTGRDATSSSPFDFPQSDSGTSGSTLGWRTRDDYGYMFNYLYIHSYVAEMQSWAVGHGLVFRTQAYGDPIDDGEQGAYVGIPEGEHLEFNGDDETQQFKVIASGAYQAATPHYLSDECCEASPYAWADPFGIDSTGSSSSPDATQGNAVSDYLDMAGGVTGIVYHGWPYTVGSPGSPAIWPGNTYGGDNSFAAGNGPNQPQFADDRNNNVNIARKDLIMRQGEPVFDVAVFHQDYGLSGQGQDGVGSGWAQGSVVANGTSIAVQPDGGKLELSSSSISQAGYLYGTVSPAAFTYPDATYSVDPANEQYLTTHPSPQNNSVLFPGHGDYRALMLYDQTTLPVYVAQKLVTLAGEGLPIVIVGPVPNAASAGSPTGGSISADATEDQAVQAAMAQVVAAPHTVVVADATANGSQSSDGNAPGALASLGIAPSAQVNSDSAELSGTTTAEPILPVGRFDPATGTYYYQLTNMNQSATAIASVTLTGNGTPYMLNTFTDAIAPIADYSATGDRETMTVRIGAANAIDIAISESDLAQSGSTATVHATGTTAQATGEGTDNVVYNSAGQLVARAGNAGNTTLAAATVTSGVPPLPVPTYATADWIDNVPNAATVTAPTGTFFMRRDFTLTATQLADMKDAALRINVDDQYEAFVNGTEVASSTIANGWETSELANIQPYLVAGKNVLAIAPYNVSAEGSTIAEIQMDFTPAAGVPGNQILIASQADGTWLADQLGGVDCSTPAAPCIASNAPANWNEPNFNDSSWLGMYESGPFGISPWTGIPVPSSPIGPQPNIILVNSVAGFFAGDTIAIDSGTSRETDVIAPGGVGTPGPMGSGITLVNNLTIVHPTGVSVVDLSGQGPFTTTLSDGDTVTSSIPVPSTGAITGTGVSSTDNPGTATLTNWQLWVDSWTQTPSGDPTVTEHSEIPACPGTSQSPGVTSTTILNPTASSPFGTPILGQPTISNGSSEIPNSPPSGNCNNTFTVTPLTSSTNGALPWWPQITPQASVSGPAFGWQDNLTNVAGIGMYNTSFNLPANWSTSSEGLYLNVGAAVDTVDVWVNDQNVPVDENDRNQIDIGPWLQAGANTLTISVATPLRNAVAVAPSTPATGQVANSAETIGTLQGGAMLPDTGLAGPVTLTPYGQSGPLETNSSSSSGGGSASVMPTVSGSVGGGVPDTVSLSLSTLNVSFGNFNPNAGTTTYNTTVAASVSSTAGGTALTVNDPDSSSNSGHLENGTYALAQPLQASAADTGGQGGVSSGWNTVANAPNSLLGWGGPVRNDTVTIGLQQTIGGNEALRAGTYSKAITFTVAVTTP